MSWCVAYPFLRKQGYVIYEPGVTPILVETKTCRSPLSTLQTNSKCKKNSQS